MSKPSVEVLIEETEKLWRRWRWVRWLMLVGGLLLVAVGILLFQMSGQYAYANAFQSPLIFSVLGAGLLGPSIANWKGSKELKLLMSFKTHHESESDET